MRIIVIGGQYPDSFAKCILTTLKDMGHDTFGIDAHKILLYGHLPRKIASKNIAFSLKGIETYMMHVSFRFGEWVYYRLRRKMEKLDPDLAIVLNARIPPSTISKIKKKNKSLKIVCWFPDHIANLGRYFILAAPYDALFFKDPYMVEIFREKLNKNTYYLPQCCHQRWHRRVKLSEEDKRYYSCDITTAGNLYYYRALIFEELLKYNYTIKIWGGPIPRWLNSPVRSIHQNHYVAELEKAKAFNAAKIVLNTLNPAEIRGVNKRTFEIAGCGGFQICDFKPELPNLFLPGEEIVVFYSLKDLIDKINYYLANPEERKKIAEKGYIRAHRDHTYEKRLEEMLKIIKKM